MIISRKLISQMFLHAQEMPMAWGFVTGEVNHWQQVYRGQETNIDHCSLQQLFQLATDNSKKLAVPEKISGIYVCAQQLPIELLAKPVDDNLCIFFVSLAVKGVYEVEFYLCRQQLWQKLPLALSEEEISHER